MRAQSDFDLGRVDTYDTRPMSAGWSKLLDIGPLADSRAGMDFAIPLTEFSRLVPQLREATGEATGEVAFTRENRLAVVDVQVQADVVLTCQRCMGPLQFRIDSEGRAALVATPAEADRVPETLETVYAADHRISLRDLVEEELLLALPLVPRHEDEYDCAGPEAVVQETAQPAGEAPEEAHRPFGQLADLLKRQ